PDGSRIVFVANGRLNVRYMKDLKIQAIPGTDGDVSEPFFSADGVWIGFWSFSDGKLKMVPVTGGQPVTICESENPFGVSWTADDRILIGLGPGGIARVDAKGGKPETIIAVDSGQVASSPQMLPDGDTVLFTLDKRDQLSQNMDWGQAQIVL